MDSEHIGFDYYASNTYSGYISYFQLNHINFKGLQLIDNPCGFFGLEQDSPYLETVINMFSKERLYSRKKYLNQWQAWNWHVAFSRSLQQAKILFY